MLAVLLPLKIAIIGYYCEAATCYVERSIIAYSKCGHADNDQFVICHYHNEKYRSSTHDQPEADLQNLPCLVQMTPMYHKLEQHEIQGMLLLSLHRPKPDLRL